MYVEGVMTANPISCTERTSIQEAAQMLATHDCGILPIVDERRHVLGVVTDRDLSIALSSEDSSRRNKTVAEVTSGKVHFCRQRDEIVTALQKLADKKIRRLVVLDDEDKLAGILSIDDIVLFTEDTLGFPDVCPEDVVRTLKSICSARRPERPVSVAR